MWLILEVYDRISYWFSVNCAGFETTTVSFIMVFLSTGPYLVYFLAMYMLLHEQTIWWFCITTGLAFNALTIWGIGLAVPLFTVNQGLCGNIIQDRPCEEAAIMFFVLGYWIVDGMHQWHELMNLQNGVQPATKVALPHYITTMSPGQRIQNDTIGMVKATLFWLMAALLCSYAQVFLHIFAVTQVILGAACGFLMGFFWSCFFNYYIEPRFDNPFMKLVVRWFCLTSHRTRVI